LKAGSKRIIYEWQNACGLIVRANKRCTSAAIRPKQEKAIVARGEHIWLHPQYTQSC